MAVDTQCLDVDDVPGLAAKSSSGPKILRQALFRISKAIFDCHDRQLQAEFNAREDAVAG